MGLTSKTGLTASPTKKVFRGNKSSTVQLKAITRPAPFVLKPFAGLYNPYPYGCSLLCNHPIDNEAKELLKKAKNSWTLDGRNVLLSDEIDAIRATLEQAHTTDRHETPRIEINFPAVESVPEELFRRYTETDSRPLTPAPTLASAATRASGSRRCVTPDPFPTNQIREKTLLVLDLRRSHSQETLSWYGSSSFTEPPLIRIQHVPTRRNSFEDNLRSSRSKSPNTLGTPFISRRPRSSRKPTKEEDELSENAKTEETELDVEDEDHFIKRRGKRRRKRGSDASRGPPAFQTSIDPETQVATIGNESHNPSARQSLVPPPHLSQDVHENLEKTKNAARTSNSLDVDSYLDVEILKQLRRELTEEIVDSEFDYKKRKALEEALKTLSKNKVNCAELVSLQKELKLPPINSHLWLSLPRVFTRSSARFELPMDSRSLSKMEPLEYVQNHVFITSARKLLYNCIFNKFKMDIDIENEHERRILGETLQNALDLMMGKPMNGLQKSYFIELIGWRNTDVFDFKTFCGICAVCERLLAPQYSPQLPDRKSDPSHEIEVADFEALARKLDGQNADPRLIKILEGIKAL